MKELYKKVRPLFKYAAGVDLKVQARLRLLGGQMYLHEQSFINAAKEYVEAAKQYKAASQPLCALAPLFYALMCNMIASEMFPEQNVVRDGRVFFDTMSVSKETEAVRQLQDSLGQQDLALNSAQSMRVAFDKCDLTALQEQVDIFRQCINARNYTNSFSDKDKENFERLLPKVWDAVRRRMMQNVLRPYKRVKLEFIGQQLRMPKADAEHMLMQMILNKKLSGRIDSETESFTFTSATTSTNPASGLFDDLLAWSDTLQTLQTNLANKLDTTPDSFGFAASALEAQMVMGGGRSVGYGGGMRGLFSKFL